MERINRVATENPSLHRVAKRVHTSYVRFDSALRRAAATATHRHSDIAVPRRADLSLLPDREGVCVSFPP